MLDVRFATTLQIMLSLALAREVGVERLSSSDLASGTATNPSLVRRLLPLLSNAGLIVSTMGREGGVALAKPPEQITLLDIHEAVTGVAPLWQMRKDIPHRCIVSGNIEAFMADLTGEAGEAIRTMLNKRTLASALADIKEGNQSELPPLPVRR